jgi:hypothetical protein
MLLNLYYILGIVVVMSLYTIIFKFNRHEKVIEWYHKFKIITKRNALKSDFRSVDDYNLFISKNIYQIFEAMWYMLGLLTGNWFIFLSVLLYSNITLSVLSDKIRFTIPGKILLFKVFLIKIIIYSALIINHFHYKVDIADLIIKSFY